MSSILLTDMQIDWYNFFMKRNGTRGPKKEYPATLYVRLLDEQKEYVRLLTDGDLSTNIRLIIECCRSNPDIMQACIDAAIEAEEPAGESGSVE